MEKLFASTFYDRLNTFLQLNWFYFVFFPFCYNINDNRNDNHGSGEMSMLTLRHNHFFGLIWRKWRIKLSIRKVIFFLAETILFYLLILVVYEGRSYLVLTENKYSACRLIGSWIIESAAYWNQILLVPLYLNSAQKTSVNWIIWLLLSLLCWPKLILLSGGHCIIVTLKQNYWFTLFNLPDLSLPNDLPVPVGSNIVIFVGAR